MHAPTSTPSARSSGNGHSDKRVFDGIVPSRRPRSIARSSGVWRKDPDDRWQRRADLAAELKWIAEGGADAEAALLGLRADIPSANHGSCGWRPARWGGGRCSRRTNADAVRTTLRRRRRHGRSSPLPPGDTFPTNQNQGGADISCRPPGTRSPMQRARRRLTTVPAPDGQLRDARIGLGTRRATNRFLLARRSDRWIFRRRKSEEDFRRRWTGHDDYEWPRVDRRDVGEVTRFSSSTHLAVRCFKCPPKGVSPMCSVKAAGGWRGYRFVPARRPRDVAYSIAPGPMRRWTDRRAIEGQHGRTHTRLERDLLLGAWHQDIWSIGAPGVSSPRPSTRQP